MKLLMIMPSVRWWFWPLLKANYEASFCDGLEPTLALCMFPQELATYPKFVVDLVRATPWIAIHEVGFGDHPNWESQVIDKNNSGLERFLPGFDGYVWTPSDDNLVPIHFFSEFVRAASTGKKVVVFSHRRGQRRGPSGYDTSDLIAAPENVKPCAISGEQYLVHSSLWQGRRFSTEPHADGRMIADVYAKYPNEFCFLPDFFLPFNAVEPGRYDNDKLKALLDA